MTTGTAKWAEIHWHNQNRLQMTNNGLSGQPHGQISRMTQLALVPFTLSAPPRYCVLKDLKERLGKSYTPELEKRGPETEMVSH